MSFVTCKVCGHDVHVACAKRVAGKFVCGDCIARGYGRVQRPPRQTAPTRASKRSDAWR